MGIGIYTSHSLPCAKRGGGWGWGQSDALSHLYALAPILAFPRTRGKDTEFQSRCVDTYAPWEREEESFSLGEKGRDEGALLILFLACNEFGNTQ